MKSDARFVVRNLIILNPQGSRNGVNRLMGQLAKLAVKYLHCTLILNNDAELSQDTLKLVHFQLTASLLNIPTKVTLRNAFARENVSDLVKKTILASVQFSNATAADDWSAYEGFQARRAEKEVFLTSFPPISIFCAQFILYSKHLKVYTNTHAHKIQSYV
eukprot:1390581-Amorphochlora_amoeboformis.AAC.1